MSSTGTEPRHPREELIHVTGGCCHSAARRHLTPVSLSSDYTCTRPRCMERRCCRRRRHCSSVLQALYYVRTLCVGGDLLLANTGGDLLPSQKHGCGWREKAETHAVASKEVLRRAPPKQQQHLAAWVSSRSSSHWRTGLNLATPEE